MRMILGSIVALVVAAVLWGSYNLGAFKPVLISTADSGPFYLMGKHHTGAYYEISPVITEVETWAQKNGFTCVMTFGLYQDDPGIVENERLRSFGGCLLNQAEWDRILKTTLPPDYKVDQFPQNNYLLASFDGSPWIGPYKVYSKAGRELAKEGKTELFPVLEVYRTDGKRIQTVYYFPR